MRLKTSESGVVKACLEYLALRGIWAWRSNNVPVFDPAKKIYRRFNGMMGVPDILGILTGGQFLGVECKTKSGKLSPDQLLFQHNASRLGALYIVARGIDDLKAAGL